ncbi:MAG: nicotinate mononucleotide-dependent phosphoribosyltransferase CobT [Cyanobacteria bacterium J06635_11]
MISAVAGHPSAWLQRHRGQKPVFTCVLSFTETGLIPHISAAGLTPQARRYTALADGEFLINGVAANPRRSLPTLAGGVSPAVISRAILTSLEIPIHLLTTGLAEQLNVPYIQLPPVLAKSVRTGQAMSLGQANALLASGLRWGRRLAQLGRYLIVSECVVGGTTTAQAVLTALGYDIAGKMSSSHRASNHAQKQAIVAQGLAVWSKAGNRSALSAVAAVGDPMQIVTAGMVIAASQQGGVLLAGGSQMLAVYALATAIAHERSLSWHREHVVVGTTRWVIEDASADTVAIAQSVKAPYLMSHINFNESPYFQLRAFEQGYVKEGMGAGGCAIAASLYKDWTRSQLRHAVEAQLRQYL